MNNLYSFFVYAFRALSLICFAANCWLCWFFWKEGTLDAVTVLMLIIFAVAIVFSFKTKAHKPEN